jgi:hypothetical protein
VKRGTSGAATSPQDIPPNMGYGPQRHGRSSSEKGYHPYRQS